MFGQVDVGPPALRSFSPGVQLLLRDDCFVVEDEQFGNIAKRYQKQDSSLNRDNRGKEFIQYQIGDINYCSFV